MTSSELLKDNVLKTLEYYLRIRARNILKATRDGCARNAREWCSRNWAETSTAHNNVYISCLFVLPFLITFKETKKR
jgi:hypothetical protein